MNGLCECGCGNPAPVAKQTRSILGHKKGKPIRFISGHNGRLQPEGELSPRWNGGKTTDSNGYVQVRNRNHPKAHKNGYIWEHRLLAEKALGKQLPDFAPVHHFNGEKSLNENGNLVVCQDNTYHRLLHVRYRALIACGNAHWRKCSFCKEHDDPSNMYFNHANQNYYHKDCASKYLREYRLKQKSLRTYSSMENI